MCAINIRLPRRKPHPWRDGRAVECARFEIVLRPKPYWGSNPHLSAIKTHAKGAYKTPTRVSFSMQNRGKLSLLWQFTLFVVSSRIAVGICSSLALENLKPLTVAQKGFLHDKERMVLTSLISEKMTDRTLTNTVGRLLIRFLL